jgi:hypothetical protein
VPYLENYFLKITPEIKDIYKIKLICHSLYEKPDFNSINTKEKETSSNQFIAKIATQEDLSSEEFICISFKIQLEKKINTIERGFSIDIERPGKFILKYLDETFCFGAEIDLSIPRQLKLELEKPGKYQFHIEPNKALMNDFKKWWAIIEYNQKKRIIYQNSDDIMKLLCDMEKEGSGYLKEFSIDSSKKIKNPTYNVIIKIGYKIY